MFKRIEDLLLSFGGIVYYIIFLKRSCYWRRNRIEKYQYKKMKKILYTCQNKIPYYIKLFKEIDFDVERDFKTLNDIKKIPVTTKKNIISHRDEFINLDYVNKAIECKSSGSTGMPLSVLVSKKQWIVEQGVVWRHWIWSGYNFRAKMAIVRSYTPKDGKLIKNDRIRNFIYYSPYNLTDENMDKYLNHMCKEKVKFLRGYPSSLEVLSSYVIRTNHKIPKLKGIFSASEILSDRSRQKIEKAFGVKVTNWYGLAECIVTMGDCEKHKGLHIFEEYGIVELLDTEDAKMKKIVGTNLHNQAMPILRYETNDIAEIGECCSCKRGQRTVKNIIGRNNMVMKLSDRDVPITNFYTLMEHYQQVGAWQIVQHNEGEIELILETTVEKEIYEDIKKEYLLRLPSEIVFYISEEKEFKKRNEGKLLPFVRMD